MYNVCRGGSNRIDILKEAAGADRGDSALRNSICRGLHLLEIKCNEEAKLTFDDFMNHEI